MEGFTSLMEEFMTSSYMDPPSHGESLSWLLATPASQGVYSWPLATWTRPVMVSPFRDFRLHWPGLSWCLFMTSFYMDALSHGESLSWLPATLTRPVRVSFHDLYLHGCTRSWWILSWLLATLTRPVMVSFHDFRLHGPVGVYFMTSCYMDALSHDESFHYFWLQPGEYICDLWLHGCTQSSHNLFVSTWNLPVTGSPILTSSYVPAQLWWIRWRPLITWTTQSFHDLFVATWTRPVMKSPFMTSS